LSRGADCLVEGHPVEGHPVEGHPVEGHPVEGHPVEGHPVDGRAAPHKYAMKPSEVYAGFGYQGR
jgi:hypothetical protein